MRCGHQISREKPATRTVFSRLGMARYVQSSSMRSVAREDRGGEDMTLPGVMLNYISRRDHRLMRRVNRWPAPRWIRLWALCATRGGDGWLWYGIGAVILLFGGPMRFRAVGAAALAAALGIVIFLNLKHAAGSAS